MAFVQTAHSLVPANPNSLRSLDNTRYKRVIAPISAADVTRAFLGPVTFTGGAFGDDVDTATANATDAYSPKTQAEKAALPGASPPNAVAGEPDFTISVDITRPRGWLEPDDPYAAPPGAGANPTITSLAPNTAVAGSPSPLAVVVTGTNFTQWSSLETGNVPSPYARYESPTKMTILMDPKRSVAGVVVVKVVDHGVKSAGTNFTYT